MTGPTPAIPQGILEPDARQPVATVHRAQMLVIIGMSGAGCSQTVQVLEDLDWYVMDNLPPRMLQPLARMMTPEGNGVHRLAVVVDVRSRSFFSELMTTLDQLQEAHIEHQTPFLDASDSVLVRCYEQARRSHPLQDEGRILDGIQAERRLLAPIRDRANLHIDTTNFSVHDLARKIHDIVSEGKDAGLNVTVMSFGFKYGLPLNADHVVDVKFFTNSYWVGELRHLSGKDEAMAKYVLERPGARQFTENCVNALASVLNGYLDELKPFVTIAMGYTEGRHRSVAMYGYIAGLLQDRHFPVRAAHRDLGKE